jgi:hypothetical protein
MTGGAGAALTGIAVTSGQQVVITLYAQYSTGTNGRGCMMSFDASGVTGVTNTAGDASGIGNLIATSGVVSAVGGSFPFTATGTGTLSVTAKYKNLGGAATCTFSSHHIMVQVFTP